MKVSYAIMNNYEHPEFVRLITQIINKRLPGDEICVIFDDPHDADNEAWLKEQAQIHQDISFTVRKWDFQTAEQRNANAAMCNGDWVFYVDTDEVLTDEHYGTKIHHLLDMCELGGYDLVWVPRINIVNPLPEGWKVNEKGWVDDFPNHIPRIHRNCDYIHWQGYLHETLVGSIKSLYLPPLEKYCIWHEKSLEKQEAAGKLYEEADRVADERGWTRQK